MVSDQEPTVMHHLPEFCSYVGRSALFDATKADRYDAYEKDIAVAHFFFSSPTVFQFTREVSSLSSTFQLKFRKLTVFL